MSGRYGGLEFELQRRLDDALYTLRAAERDDLDGRNYFHGVTFGLGAALGIVQGTNAAHELNRSADRIDASDRGDQ